jgi:hypothetical protein
MRREQERIGSGRDIFQRKMPQLIAAHAAGRTLGAAKEEERGASDEHVVVTARAGRRGVIGGRGDWDPHVRGEIEHPGMGGESTMQDEEAEKARFSFEKNKDSFK